MIKENDREFFFGTDAVRQMENKFSFKFVFTFADNQILVETFLKRASEQSFRIFRFVIGIIVFFIL